MIIRRLEILSFARNCQMTHTFTARARPVGLRAAYDSRMICEEGGPPTAERVTCPDGPENEIDPIDIHSFSKWREGGREGRQAAAKRASETSQTDRNIVVSH